VVQRARWCVGRSGALAFFGKLSKNARVRGNRPGDDVENVQPGPTTTPNGRRRRGSSPLSSSVLAWPASDCHHFRGEEVKEEKKEEVEEEEAERDAGGPTI